MEYFKILNLQREPFSNSPEPEFFYHSDEHLTCLQKLELAVRLRRGLNLVIGEVGTGKTTLCRQIILKFSRTEEDRQQIETYLIMDPSFSNALEFLSTVALLLGVKTAANKKSEWQLKENIKNYLFKRGIDESKIIVLIIDEGQKLPSFCLEILREFLNYETSEYKLLQIVIFAQREIDELLRAHANFADRVNQYNYLRPLNFKNTKNMIKFRIARASANPSAVPSLFSLPALWAIYRATGGYPRKIITLCHQVVLTMIIQNRAKAGFFLVRSCAARHEFTENAKRPKWNLGLMAAGLLVFLVIMYIGLVVGKVVAPPFRKGEKAVSAVEPQPKMLGQLVLKKQENVLRLLECLYGKDAKAQREAVARANPHLRNRDTVSRGEMIKIPARLDVKNPLPPGKCWVQIISLKNITKAFDFMNDSSETRHFFLLPYWNQREGIIFAVLLKKGFTDEAAARLAVNALPPPLAKSAHIVSKWPDDTVFL